MLLPLDCLHHTHVCALPLRVRTAAHEGSLISTSREQFCSLDVICSPWIKLSAWSDNPLCVQDGLGSKKSTWRPAPTPAGKCVSWDDVGSHFSLFTVFPIANMRPFFFFPPFQLLPLTQLKNWERKGGWGLSKNSSSLRALPDGLHSFLPPQETQDWTERSVQILALRISEHFYTGKCMPKSRNQEEHMNFNSSIKW